MIHKNRANRRYIRNKKIEKRLRLMNELGEQGGSLYEKHVSKIKNKSGGYMSKHGNYTHYGNKSHYGSKVREDRYGPSENWDPKSKRRINEMDDQMKEFQLLETNIEQCEKCFYEEQYSINDILESICVHIQSMKGEEAIKSYELCKNVPKDCPYFRESKILCRDCLSLEKKHDCNYDCPKMKE